MCTASRMVSVTAGTTDERIAPSTAVMSARFISNAILSMAAYSSTVAVGFVETRSRKMTCPSAQQPMTMLVLPISMAKIMGGPPFNLLF